ncbi:GntR family transcriptional regulator [Peribacillus sp. NPDC006672]|uniref:GntR family transcriptional regulator n=1 Tax=Peribacillus sp. NPDC006672 TaxID=3390606 RepID=UPI003CFD9CCA
MLTRNSSIPLYEQLSLLFKEKIESGEWEPGKQLASERELCELHGVSRITVRQAIDILENKGLLKRTHGVGTFVASQSKLDQPLGELKSFHRTLIQKGIVASTKIVSYEQAMSTVQVAKVLNIDLTDKVIELQLLGYGDDHPIVFYDSIFPARIGERMLAVAKEAEENQIPFSTLDLYREKLSIKPTHLEQTFEAITADTRLSSILNVSEGWPIFQVTSIMYHDTEPLEYREAFYHGDKYRFFINRPFPDSL